MGTPHLCPIREVIAVETHEVVWEGKVGSTPLKVGVAHSERIIAEWTTPQGPRHKVASSMEEFERAVLFQLLLSSGADVAETREVVAAVAKAQIERPRPAPPQSERRRKKPKPKHHRRSRRPPLRR